MVCLSDVHGCTELAKPSHVLVQTWDVNLILHCGPEVDRKSTLGGPDPLYLHI